MHLRLRKCQTKVCYLYSFLLNFIIYNLNIFFLTNVYVKNKKQFKTIYSMYKYKLNYTLVS